MSTAAPPAPISPNEQSAEILADKLLTMVGLGEAMEQEEKIAYESVKTDIYTPDVEGDVVNFAFQVSWANRFGLSLPCVPAADGYPIPISLFPERIALIQPSKLTEELFDRPDPWWFAGIPELELSYVSTKESRDFFRRRLIRFLTARFSARQSDISTGPGLQFTVETDTKGLRVHYSPAYFFEPEHVLNSPTSPVTGWIQPGRYIFGAGPLGKKPDFDFTAEYDIPPHTFAKLGI